MDNDSYKTEEHEIYIIDGIQTLIYSVKGNVAKGAILRDDLTLKDCYIVKHNNLFAHGDTLKEARESLQEKIMMNMSAEERVEIFIKEFPDPDALIPHTKFFDWHHKVTGSCKTGREHWMESRGYKMEDSSTVRKFITETVDDYGSEVIRAIQDEYVKLGVWGEVKSEGNTTED